ncbi:hypothetical protein SCHPADRAFT_741882 [Schizopora paradoxa]|uniref:Uncharacterized protein n=1 Tax=Schizopora paradoxa TaxID=27342 RepID=A0A0H2R661_9AGAM|nr:hypothetical protein SCHPADRAFT_741882 [Schizopora paradoxa]
MCRMMCTPLSFTLDVTGSHQDSLKLSLTHFDGIYRRPPSGRYAIGCGTRIRGVYLPAHRMTLSRRVSMCDPPPHGCFDGIYRSPASPSKRFVACSTTHSRVNDTMYRELAKQYCVNYLTYHWILAYRLSSLLCRPLFSNIDTLSRLLAQSSVALMVYIDVRRATLTRAYMAAWRFLSMPKFRRIAMTVYIDIRRATCTQLFMVCQPSDWINMCRPLHIALRKPP